MDDCETKLTTVTDCDVLLGYAGGQPVYHQDMSQSAGFVGQNAVSTGYAQMQPRQQDPQVYVESTQSQVLASRATKSRDKPGTESGDNIFQ